MSTEHIVALLRAGGLAVDLWRAEAAAMLAKDAYIARIRQFESRHGDVDGRLSPVNPAHTKLIAYTAAKREALQAARRKLYATRRRLRVECQKVARLAANTKGKS